MTKKRNFCVFMDFHKNERDKVAILLKGTEKTPYRACSLHGVWSSKLFCFQGQLPICRQNLDFGDRLCVAVDDFCGNGVL